MRAFFWLPPFAADLHAMMESLTGALHPQKSLKL